GTDARLLDRRRAGLDGLLDQPEQRTVAALGQDERRLDVRRREALHLDAQEDAVLADALNDDAEILEDLGGLRIELAEDAVDGLAAPAKQLGEELPRVALEHLAGGGLVEGRAMGVEAVEAKVKLAAGGQQLLGPLLSPGRARDGQQQQGE